MLLDAEDHLSEDSESSFGRKVLEVVGDCPFDLLGDEFGMIFLVLFAGVLIIYGGVITLTKWMNW